MLYFSYSFLINMFLLLLVSSVALCHGDVAITLCSGVEDPDIKKCVLSIVTPEALCNNVKMSTIFSVGSPVMELFISEWLQGWFNPNTVAGFREKLCS